jgi:RsiW-degrading membrane proteinase PrsW (M82 family)
MDIEIKHIIVFLLAVIPAAIWLYLFWSKHRADKRLMALVFAGGMVAAKLILIYQGYWDKTINLIFFKVNPVDFSMNIKDIFSSSPVLALFLSFVGVGVMEEFLKFWIMKFIGRRFFKSIDDVIMLAIVSALGFAFYENIIYFIIQWDALSTGDFAKFAMLRVTVTTMLHVLCSGILGYYFGMAYYASPMLKIQYMKRKRHPVLQFLKDALYIKKSFMYHNEMMALGLIFAMGLHAIYDFVMKINIVFIRIPLSIPIMLIYFFGGFWLLSRLFRIKDFNLKLGLVGTEIMPKKDFIKLLNEVQEIKERMKNEAGSEVPEHMKNRNENTENA